ncbi:biotin-independent malonate decarboxylase subunit gamma [Pseudazoarcus pumilus]|uniref:Biotin-independent malonate decarboxylase subunit gamma n=1 Tax=Pseudazoarcus pumilus TaxID=2067960 RepID=A0A2I6S7W9_9RHOO|nr:biotin-independent malonate decarboxylase subunit gamma [Pseudazoarcus pumilus]AUN95369.1 biotin-independent malonate decarboxylase subunit gamma [Pseudazoarcus pumilus]
MTRDELLDVFFGGSFQADHADDHCFTGRARVGDETVTVIGTAGRAEVGVDLCLRMAAAVLECVRERPGEAIVFFLDTQGQRLRRRDELLGLNGYMAHLAKCCEVARRRGHPLLSVVYGEAVSGGYLTTGMMADACYAVRDAEIKVMNLPAMARITKVPLERLEELAGRSPVFSPGADNYLAMGHLRAIWSDDYTARLAAALADLRTGRPADDTRMDDGLARGGRRMAAPIAAEVAGHD